MEKSLRPRRFYWCPRQDCTNKFIDHGNYSLEHVTGNRRCYAHDEWMKWREETEVEVLKRKIKELEKSK